MEFDALETLFFCSNGDDGTRFLVAEARSYGARCHRVEEVELRAMASGEDAQNVVGIARQQLKSPEEAFAGAGVWLALESVNNDGNLGSMMRTAEAGGARGIVACGPDVDFWAPKAVRASMGAIFSQSLVRASWRDLLAFKNESNARWIGTALENARSYEQVEFGRNFWLWMGDERQGLSRRSLEASLFPLPTSCLLVCSSATRSRFFCVPLWASLRPRRKPRPRLQLPHRRPRPRFRQSLLTLLPLAQW